MSDIKDPEIRAMSVLVDHLEPLDQDERSRVLAQLAEQHKP
jgi:hypothetical protein